MFKRISLQNFRCFFNFELTNLKRINLFAGKNNVGKSTLLEAIFLICGRCNLDLVMKISGFRGVSEFKLDLSNISDFPWASIFPFFNVKNEIVLKAWKYSMPNPQELVFTEIDSFEYFRSLAQSPISVNKKEIAQLNEFIPANTKGLRLAYKDGELSNNYHLFFTPNGPVFTPSPPPPDFPAYYQLSFSTSSTLLSEQASLYSRLLVQKEPLDQLIETLHIIEPRLTNIQAITEGAFPQLYGDIGGPHLIPFSCMGEGVVKIASILLKIFTAKTGVLLIDELENGLHFSILPKIWEAIIEAAEKNDTQLFITTHSMECILAAHKAFSQYEEYGLNLVRLENIEGLIKPILFEKEELDMITERQLEVR